MCLIRGCFFILMFAVQSCKQKESKSIKGLVNEIDLKRGQTVSCGPSEKLLGSVDFQIDCSESVKIDFDLALLLLHSFEYDEAEKVFARVIDKEPGCAMAYWGVAMSNFHPLWAPPTNTELKKGAKAIQIARSIPATERESAFIAAIGSFYDDWEVKDHRSRCLEFEKKMEEVYADFPADKEAAIFYSLALDAAADPNDKSFARQKKAGSILQALYPGQPNHPGIAHYLIHTFDYPSLAKQGLDAARNYASIAPSSAHALHMPSHIFIRLGYWDESIRSNLASVSSARCYAEGAGMKGHWDEELHGLDYLVYAYLQKGENDSAKKAWDYLRTINTVYPVNFKVAYAFAAIPARYVLENKMWQEAANLEVYPQNFTWKSFPWQEAHFHFTRLLGAVHTGNTKAANDELEVLGQLHDTLINRGEGYAANQVAIQINISKAWILLKRGKKEDALVFMQTAADMEDKTEKHPVTPGEVLPARELLGDMFLELGQPARALEAYEANLLQRPNRFNSVYGAGLAAENLGDFVKATAYFQQLVNLAGNASTVRNEVNECIDYLKKHAHQ
jgi:hypothetical protein